MNPAAIDILSADVVDEEAVVQDRIEWRKPVEIESQPLDFFSITRANDDGVLAFSHPLFRHRIASDVEALSIEIDLDGAIEAVVEVNLDVRPLVPAIKREADDHDREDGNAGVAKARPAECRPVLP